MTLPNIVIRPAETNTCDRKTPIFVDLTVERLCTVGAAAEKEDGKVCLMAVAAFTILDSDHMLEGLRLVVETHELQPSVVYVSVMDAVVLAGLRKVFPSIPIRVPMYYVTRHLVSAYDLSTSDTMKLAQQVTALHQYEHNGIPYVEPLPSQEPEAQLPSPSDGLKSAERALHSRREIWSSFGLYSRGTQVHHDMIWEGYIYEGWTEYWKWYLGIE